MKAPIDIAVGIVTHSGVGHPKMLKCCRANRRSVPTNIAPTRRASKANPRIGRRRVGRHEKRSPNEHRLILKFRFRISKTNRRHGGPAGIIAPASFYRRPGAARGHLRVLRFTAHQFRRVSKLKRPTPVPKNFRRVRRSNSSQRTPTTRRRDQNSHDGPPHPARHHFAPRRLLKTSVQRRMQLPTLASKMSRKLLANSSYPRSRNRRSPHATTIPQGPDD